MNNFCIYPETLKHRLAILLIMMLGILKMSYGQSCEINGEKHYSYNDIKGILDRNKCANCHYNGSLINPWNYDSYSDMFLDSKCNSKIIVHGKPNASLLIDKLNGGPTACGNAMPFGQIKMSDQDLLVIETWIEFGAPEYCISDFDQIKSILENNKCNTCHNSAASWSFSDYNVIFNSATTTSCGGEIITKFDANTSFLYQKISSLVDFCGEPMLVDGQKMEEKEVAKIRDWINAGAPESAKVLPVNLTEFTTDNIDDQSIVLNWHTASEKNTYLFEVQHSMDGIQFETIKSIPSKGNTGGNYNFIDQDISVGFNFYRLKIIDYDNSIYYSPIRVERIKNIDEIFQFYPIPTQNNELFTVEWYPTDGREKVRMNLMNIAGSQCASYVINNGINHFNFSDLKAGVYYISIEDYNFNRTVKKIVILDL